MQYVRSDIFKQYNIDYTNTPNDAKHHVYLLTPDERPLSTNTARPLSYDHFFSKPVHTQYMIVWGLLRGKCGTFISCSSVKKILVIFDLVAFSVHCVVSRTVIPFFFFFFFLGGVGVGVGGCCLWFRDVFNP